MKSQRPKPQGDLCEIFTDSTKASIGDHKQKPVNFSQAHAGKLQATKVVCSLHCYQMTSMDGQYTATLI